jgi:hypothetical protein
MKNTYTCLIVAALATLTVGTMAPQSPLDADKIAAAAGTKATTTKDGVVRIAWARDDVAVKVDGMQLKPFAGLGSWAAFTRAPHGAMVMGDTVVFQDEVTPAMDAAFEQGLEVTALHNHFFYDEPKVYFMHIGGNGDPEKVASAVKSVWDAIKKVRADRSQPAERFPGSTPSPGQLDAHAVQHILGNENRESRWRDQGNYRPRGQNARRESGWLHGPYYVGSILRQRRLRRSRWRFYHDCIRGTASTANAAQKRYPYCGIAQPHGRRRASVLFHAFLGKGPARQLAEGLRATLDAQKDAQGAKHD